MLGQQAEWKLKKQAGGLHLHMEQIQAEIRDLKIKRNNVQGFVMYPVSYH